VVAALALTLAPFAARAQGSPQIERGRYMVLTGHCNNCHTVAYAPKEGNVSEKDWLLGSGPLGWRGPWGTTYASNLRPICGSQCLR
jgi:mono/diheme cytochrome c family protein